MSAPEKKKRKRHVFGRRKVSIDEEKFTVSMTAEHLVVRHHRHRRQYKVKLQRVVPLLMQHAPLE